jgi:hypothetical protein
MLGRHDMEYSLKKEGPTTTTSAAAVARLLLEFEEHVRFKVDK